MRFLKPETVARSARALFKTGHSEALIFFVLKAEGATTDHAVRVRSSEQVPESLKLLAGQPPGFDRLVVENLKRFAGPNNAGLPTRPGTRGSVDDYTFYFPISEESQYLLRKAGTNRSVVYTNLTRERKTAPANGDKARLDEIVSLERDAEHGVLARFVPGYEYKALWYYGPAAGATLSVPLQHLAIWLHRTDDLPNDVTLDNLVTQTVSALHLTAAERALLFYDTPVSLLDKDYTTTFNPQQYFSALCLPPSGIVLPDIQITSRNTEMTQERWDFISKALGYDAQPQPNVVDAATDLFRSGERTILFFGPPRTGKSHAARAVAARFLDVAEDQLFTDSRFVRVQFHQGWTYGDFIRKLAPTAEAGDIVFTTLDGIFLRHCTQNASRRSVFVVDELNRANIAEVFGEAFQVLETGYRGQPVTLAIAPVTSDQPRSIVIPKEMLLLFTANDLDKSTSAIDFALLERLSTVRCDVDHVTIVQILRAGGWSDDNSLTFVILLKDIEDISGFPIGQANFFDFGAPPAVRTWYSFKLRPVLAQFLTVYRKVDLERIDALVNQWLASDLN